MNETLTVCLGIYMLVGMFALVGSGTLEALTSGWIDTIHKRGFLGLTQGLLYLVAVGQITIFWALWPLVLWHAHTEAQRIERRRVP